jgi:RNA polymerase sigma factor (sigma-70 family)
MPSRIPEYETILRRMNDGTPDALFEAHLHLAASIGRSFPMVNIAIEETEQEARLALWKTANAYDSTKGAFENFAPTVIRNHLRNVFNKAKRESVEIAVLDVQPNSPNDTEVETLKDSILSPEASPLLAAERADIRASIQSGLADLTSTQRDVLQSYADGLSQWPEIKRWS